MACQINTLKLPVSLPGKKAYDRHLPLNNKKVAKLRKVMQYTPQENKNFHNKMFLKITKATAEDKYDLIYAFLFPALFLIFNEKQF